MTALYDESLDLFDDAVAVRARDEGSYEASLHAGFTGLGRPNGGYLLAVAASAGASRLAQLGVAHPHCLAASASYVRAASAGPAVVDVVVQRTGARISHVRATVVQGDRVIMEALLNFGRLTRDGEVRHDAHVPPVMPAVEDCPRSPSDTELAMLGRVELRLDPATTGFARGEVAQEAEIRGWVRLAGGRRADDRALLFLADMLPPATFQIGSVGWVPTIQLSVYVRSLPAQGWLAARQSARFVSAGLMDETCELWDADGRLVAQAVQLAMVRFPATRAGR